MLPNKVYDVAKYVLQIVVPALVVLIAGIGALYGVDVSKLTALLTLLATFGGSVLGISSAVHQNKTSDEKED